MQLKNFLQGMLVATLLTLPALGAAQTVLTVTASERSLMYTMEDLLALPQTTVITKNDYVDDTTTFQGPRLRLVLDAVEIKPSATLKMVALNDFKSIVPAKDAFNYDVILAVSRDGEAMSVRDKGPIWVIYPMNDHPELQEDSYNGRLVWQLKSISGQ